MSITELCVKRPLAVIMVLILVMGLGVYGYMNIGADLFPSVDTPFISIETIYPGAGSEEIEKDIAKPIENAVSGISGIDTLRSVSGQGYCYTILKFTMETDLSDAFMDVQQALGDTYDKLPKDAYKPVLRKFNKNAEPVMMLTVSGSIPYEELYNNADAVKQYIEKLPGVGNVELVGAYEKELSIKIDKPALEHYGIAINTVINILQASNLNIPAGQITHDSKSQTMRIVGEFNDINKVRNLRIPLMTSGSVPVFEVADVSLDYPKSTNAIRFNNTPSIGVLIQKQSDANIVETTNIIKSELKKLDKRFTSDVRITVASDSSLFINSTLKEMNANLIEGIITTSLVMFLFLKQVRSSLIVLVSIPTSLIATFFMMYVMDFTLNILSLLALSVSIGILVDDSIVVLENIQRHLRMGKNPTDAAIEGRKEIAMAAIAITLCDIVVFGPIAFMSDMIGKFFREFGLTVVCATAFSLIVSFTLTPMLSAKLLGKEDKHMEDEGKSKTGIISKFLEMAVSKYRELLVWSLSNRLKVVGIVTAGFFISVSLIPLKIIGTEFLPSSDQGKFTVDISLNPDSSFTQTDTKVKIVEGYLKTLPEVKNILSEIGSKDKQSVASINVDLVEKSKRKRSQRQVANSVRKFGKEMTGIDFNVTEGSIVGRTSDDSPKPVVLNVTGPNSEVLKQLSKQVENIVKSIPGIIDVSNTVSTSQSEISVKIDPLASSEYGIRPLDIYNTLKSASDKGVGAGTYRENGSEYDIIVRFKDGQVVTPKDLSSIKLTNSLGQQISLSQTADINLSDTPQQKLRMNKKGQVMIAANMQGRTLGSITDDIKKKLKSINIPDGYEITFGGDQANMSTSFPSLIGALIVSLFLVYMILVMLYESLLTPMIRMLSLPCGTIGALLALALTGRTLSIVSMIGLIMLDGLASKNGTLLIDYTNTLMKRGMPLKEALLESGTTRLRPIIMTSVTMIVGMLPSALAMSDGSEIKSSMSIALIGGLITSTILSPLLIPVSYTLINDMRTRFSRRLKSKVLEVNIHEATL